MSTEMHEARHDRLQGRRQRADARAVIASPKDASRAVPRRDLPIALTATAAARPPPCGDVEPLAEGAYPGRARRGSGPRRFEQALARGVRGRARARSPHLRSHLRAHVHPFDARFLGTQFSWFTDGARHDFRSRRSGSSPARGGARRRRPRLDARRLAPRWTQFATPPRPPGSAIPGVWCSLSQASPRGPDHRCAIRTSLGSPDFSRKSPGAAGGLEAMAFRGVRA